MVCCIGGSSAGCGAPSGETLVVVNMLTMTYGAVLFIILPKVARRACARVDDDAPLQHETGNVEVW